MVEARCRRALAAFALLLVLGHATPARADLAPAPTVTGTDVTRIHVAARREDLAASDPVAFGTLGTTSVTPGPRWLGFSVAPESAAVLVPVCAGRKRVLVDGVDVAGEPGPLVFDVPRDARSHEVTIQLDIGSYEHRVACSGPPVVGVRAMTRDGLRVMTFASSHAGGGKAALYVPPGHDTRRPAAVLVGLHPWNGSIWTYAAYDALLDAARAADVVLLMPSGLGNSLYTAPAEEEALGALAALGDALRVDPDRITLWGASMGGAGATTVGFHHPDRFAAIVSLFGDSRYDLATYVRGILRDEAGAHRVNAFDIADNARNVPVWLIHGEDDRVSPVAQSAMLARALEALHFTVRFDRVPGAGHEGRVVAAFAERIVLLAARTRRIAMPRRVSFWSVRPGDVEAYGIRMKRQPAGDAFFDVERTGDTVHLRRATGARALALPRGAFGFAPTETAAIVIDDPNAKDVAVSWDALP